MSVLTGTFDEVLDKMGTIVFINTVNQFMNYCLDENITPTLDSIKEYILKKTGKEISNEVLEVILKFAVGNVQLFVIFMLEEFCEKISEDMLDKQSTYLNAFKRWF